MLLLVSGLQGLVEHSDEGILGSWQSLDAEAFHKSRHGIAVPSYIIESLRRALCFRDGPVEPRVHFKLRVIEIDHISPLAEQRIIDKFEIQEYRYVVLVGGVSNDFEDAGTSVPRQRRLQIVRFASCPLS